MKLTKKKIGNKGEDIAVEFLKKHGYRIIERNFRSSEGEIDIIALDKGTLCFIEVKTRRSVNFGLPLDGVDFFKQQQIIRVAQSYLIKKRITEVQSRFDVVSIFITSSNIDINLIKNAFEA
ncbi:MAG: YraN family protein [Deltaproteobacteria bacterium]|nr:YraN family protein [Deltaproteobacteria bacterium]RLA89082.1 MAG: YraN family protein [Deltaproteobacteria bacterium]